MNKQRGDLKFSERLYISKVEVYDAYAYAYEEFLAAVPDLDQAVLSETKPKSESIKLFG